MVLELDRTNFEEEVMKSELPVIIDFWAEWCGPCKVMETPFTELSREYEDRLKFAKLDTGRCQEIASKYNIRSIPCFVVTKRGEEVGRIVGNHLKNDFKKQIDAILEKYDL